MKVFIISYGDFKVYNGWFTERKDVTLDEYKNNFNLLNL